MPRAIYIMPFPPDASMPPMQAESGPQLHYVDAKGNTAGGYSCVGNVPNAPTCYVLVDTLPETHAWMQAQPEYLLDEEVPGETE